MVTWFVSNHWLLFIYTCHFRYVQVHWYDTFLEVELLSMLNWFPWDIPIVVLPEMWTSYRMYTLNYNYYGNFIFTIFLYSMYYLPKIRWTHWGLSCLILVQDPQNSWVRVLSSIVFSFSETAKGSCVLNNWIVRFDTKHLKKLPWNTVYCSFTMSKKILSLPLYSLGAQKKHA